MIKKVLRIALIVVLFLGLFGSANRLALAQPAAVSIPFSSVPVEYVQLAAQQLEDMRGSQMAPNWGPTANLDPNVVPLYRPDLFPKIAYYEFTVRLSGKDPAGFIIVSAGAHDFPIPHWNSQGLSPSAVLDAMAAQKGITLANYYRLDALSYAGEDANGTNVVMSNDQLAKIDGLGLDTIVPSGSDNTWTPSPTTDDSKPDPSSWKQTMDGPQTAGYKISPWASWGEEKAGYAQAYGLLLNHLADQAAQDWNILAQANQFGERLSKGDVRNIAVLCSDISSSNIAVTGDGVKFATLSLIPRVGMNPLYNISVFNDEYGVEHTLTIQITCPNNLISTYRYIITAPSFHIFLPVTKNSSGTTALAQSATSAAPMASQSVSQSISPSANTSSNLKLMGDWGPWTYYWAFNGTADARLYDQLTAGTLPNNSSCYSGCGATAWGMLFGWADYEAQATNTWNYWKPRPGIYRVGGGTGADAVAPQYPDSGVYNMIWQIRNFIGTFCFSGSGATAPWNMSGAWQYLAPRTGTRLETHYNVIGWTEGGLRDLAVSSIRYRQTPAIIGTGWLSHYPLAMGYAEQSRTVRACDFCWWDTTQYSRWFWVNQGWGGSGNGWVSADTWFDGEIYP